MCIDYTQLCCTSKLENCSENEVGTEFELKNVQGCINVVSVCKIDHSLYHKRQVGTEFELKNVQGCINVVSVCKIDHSL